MVEHVFLLEKKVTLLSPPPAAPGALRQQAQGVPQLLGQNGEAAVVVVVADEIQLDPLKGWVAFRIWRLVAATRSTTSGLVGSKKYRLPAMGSSRTEMPW